MIEGESVSPTIPTTYPRIVLFSPTVEGVCRYVQLVRMELDIGSIRIKFHLKMPEIGTVALTLAHVTGRKNNFTHEAYRLDPAILMDAVECTGHIIHPASTVGITSLLVTDEFSSHGTHHWCAIDGLGYRPFLLRPLGHPRMRSPSDRQFLAVVDADGVACRDYRSVDKKSRTPLMRSPTSDSVKSSKRPWSAAFRTSIQVSTCFCRRRV